MIGEDAADPDRCRHLIFRHADSLADQILGLPDAGFRADVNAGMTEEARRKDRNGDEAPGLLEQRHRVGRQRQFRGIEFLEADHPEERLLDRHVEVIEVDPVGLYRTVGEGTGAIVIPAAEREFQFRHW